MPVRHPPADVRRTLSAIRRRTFAVMALALAVRHASRVQPSPVSALGWMFVLLGLVFFVTTPAAPRGKARLRRVTWGACLIAFGVYLLSFLL